tara:strand:+ start:1317 stop:1679 length:363 start_codon:yes stop_codon:yes gene_type:complete
MPRKPVDEVKELRVTLGTKEREFAEGVVSAYQFNQVATPLVAAISDVSFWITLAAILALFGINVQAPGDDDVRSWADATRYAIDDFRAARGTATPFDDLAVLFRVFTVPGFIYTAGQVNA